MQDMIQNIYDKTLLVYIFLLSLLLLLKVLQIFPVYQNWIFTEIWFKIFGQRAGTREVLMLSIIVLALEKLLTKHTLWIVSLTIF